MKEKDYIAGLGFVAGALSRGIEALPEYHVEPEKVFVTEVQPPQVGPEVVIGSSQGHSGCNSKQSVKRTCGHSQKSTRVKHAGKK